MKIKASVFDCTSALCDRSPWVYQFCLHPDMNETSRVMHTEVHIQFHETPPPQKNNKKFDTFESFFVGEYHKWASIAASRHATQARLTTTTAAGYRWKDVSGVGVEIAVLHMPTHTQTHTFTFTLATTRVSFSFILSFLMSEVNTFFFAQGPKSNKY